MAKNYLITGIPRSGTSLLTSTLQDVPNFVALSEPVQLKPLRKTKLSHGEYASKLQGLIEEIRGQIERGEALPNRFEIGGGTVATNYFARVAESGAPRSMKTYEVRYEHHEVVDSEFVLCIKDNAQFSACLDMLTALPETRIVAVMRDPVACILSWRSLDLSISNGRQPAGEKLAPELKAIRKLDDLLLRQVRIIDWYFEQYWRFRAQIGLLRYEDLMEEPGILRTLFPLPQSHRLPSFESMNARPEYRHEEAPLIREYLLRETKYVRRFYPDL